MSRKRRTGSRSYGDISESLRRQIESGRTETASHVEQMAIDMGALLRQALPQLDAESEKFVGIGFLERMRLGGRILWSHYNEDISHFSSARSDVVRGWAAMAVGQANSLSLEQRLSLITPFALDAHFAVREWAWLALRPHVADELESAIAALSKWVVDREPYIRRFAIEVTRPRSVWGKHLAQLKENPQPGLQLITPLVCEPARYVANSVGNWLNDAAKDHPGWVGTVTAEWSMSCTCPDTKRIVRRATRSLRAAEASRDQARSV